MKMKRLLSLLLALTLMAAVLPAQPAKAGLSDVLKMGNLEFDSGARGEWKKLSGDKIQVRFQVTNHSLKTVKGFELYVYATDIWGERIYGESTYYYWTTVKKIAPGKTAYSDWITLPDRSQVDQLHCAVKRVVDTDGNIREIQDSKLDYWCWDVVW